MRTEYNLLDNCFSLLHFFGIDQLEGRKVKQENKFSDFRNKKLIMYYRIDFIRM